MFLDKLKEVENRYNKLCDLLSDPATLNDQKEFTRIAKERSAIEDTVNAYVEYKSVTDSIAEYKEILDGSDKDLKEIAKDELPDLNKRKEELEDELKVLLLPKDPNDEKNIILEIRAGAGGDESTLFASELFRAYSKYADIQGWKVDILSANATGLNGYKEVIALIEGSGAYSKLKYESGVHRVQRVPETESSGRRHTSTVTVAVMPEAEAVEVNIEDKDLRIDTFRAGGAGGQGVNKLETAVRITHLPTNTVVSCQDEKSQLKNRQKAMKVLLARILDKEMREQHEKQASDRKTQIGTGDRSEKIRTYNFPQNRITDHRVGLTLHKLSEIMEGELDEMIDNLTAYFQAELLKSAS